MWCTDKVFEYKRDSVEFNIGIRYGYVVLAPVKGVGALYLSLFLPIPSADITPDVTSPFSYTGMDTRKRLPAISAICMGVHRVNDIFVYYYSECPVYLVDIISCFVDFITPELGLEKDV